MQQVVKRDSGGVDDSIDSSPEQQGYQTKSFVVTRRTKLPDTVSSVLQFKLSVELSGFSAETLGIINAAHHFKEIICCFDQLLSILLMRATYFLHNIYVTTVKTPFSQLT